MTLLIFFALIISAITAFSAGSTDILGVWRSENDESQVEIFKCGAELCGKIVWLKNPKYANDSKNPDPSLRDRPLIGLKILEGFRYHRDNTWGDGSCYDPKNGKTYRGKIHLAAPDRLELRGFVGIPLFGRTTEWNR
jgi:uncharacterized protein (DUF2147 family)